MNGLEIINRSQILGKTFTMYGSFENPLFLAKDVANWIEHSDVSMMLQNIDKEENLMQTMLVSGQNRQMWFLTEYGLYEVLMQSRKPIAKKFKHGVKKILKEIRMNNTHARTYEKSLPKNYEEALEELLINVKENRQLKETIQENEPKVTFAEAITISETTISIAELAKILRTKYKIEIGANRLYQYLREGGFLIKKHGADYNSPTQKSIELGILKIEQKPYKDENGSIFISKSARVTGKGQVYFVKYFLGCNFTYFDDYCNQEEYY
ncbi:MAG: phage antirepressor KilAC domain-containing protein [Defluviitaleaceae bacterium]|nr:phage antirepressor KilAC domain-containing protein [Defluviitaleaceae bacterium]